MFTLVGWQGLHVVLLSLMAAYAIARYLTGRLDAIRRNTFDNMRIYWYFSVAQALVALIVILLPRMHA
jgi:heme/copper-type cytochrome/quinol oxidase subunit 3